jgi:hypothetical protein
VFAGSAKNRQTPAVPDWMRALFGDVTGDELVLVGVIVALILAFSWAPRIGEAIGGLFDERDERDDRDDRDDPS